MGTKEAEKKIFSTTLLSLSAVLKDRIRVDEKIT
jgi:hypothetical protein